MPCFPRAARFLVLALLLLAPAGCGKGYKLASVSGRVTMDNHPLTGAEVSFFPVDGGKDTPYASGMTDEQGNYKLQVSVGSSTSDGAVVGENLVRISRDKRRGSKKVSPQDLAHGRLDEIPAKYNDQSKITFTVPPGGSSEANFELTSK
jgi:hypothetical protein